MSSDSMHNMWLSAYNEVISEVSPKTPSHMTMEEFMDILKTDIYPMRGSYVLLGVADDNFPVYLDTRGSWRGSIGVIADKHGGKTSMMQFMAFSVSFLSPDSNVHYCVIAKDNAWGAFIGKQNCKGVFMFGDKATESALRDIYAIWLGGGPRLPLLLFIDDFDCLEYLSTYSRKITLELITRGASRNIWPIVGVTPAIHMKHIQWGTRVFGKLSAESRKIFAVPEDTYFPYFNRDLLEAEGLGWYIGFENEKSLGIYCPIRVSDISQHVY